MLVLSRTDLERLLDPPAVIEALALEAAFRDAAAGRAVALPRAVLPLAQGSVYLGMALVRGRGHLPRRLGGSGRSPHPGQGAGDHPASRQGGIGRGCGEQITLFKSVGGAPEDAAAARLAYDRAMAQGVGTEVSL